MADCHEAARDKFVDLREQLELMPWPTAKGSPLQRDPVWRAKFHRLVVSIGLCFAEDPNRARALCGEFVPHNCRQVYERFVTGTTVDMTPSQLRDELRRTHNPVTLKHASQIVDATICGDGSVTAHFYKQVENSIILTRYWERKSCMFSNRHEFDAAVLAIRKSDPGVVVTVSPSPEYKLHVRRVEASRLGFSR
jgi:hypothetical protein